MYKLLFQHLLYLTNESYPRGENRRGRGKGSRAVCFDYILCLFLWNFRFFLLFIVNPSNFPDAQILTTDVITFFFQWNRVETIKRLFKQKQRKLLQRD